MKPRIEGISLHTVYLSPAHLDDALVGSELPTLIPFGELLGCTHVLPADVRALSASRVMA